MQINFDRRLHLAAMAGVALLLISGCGAAGPKGPKLVSFADRQRATIEPAMNSGTYGSIADRLEALPQDAYQGTDVVVSETILNDGAPSQGIRLTVKGSAVASGMLGLPTKAEIAGQLAGGKQSQVLPIEFAADTTGGWQASIPEIKYAKTLEITMILPAAHGGHGDLQLFVYPLDKNGLGSATVAHNYRVLDERDTPDNAMQVPTD
jgi:hypothetical protein